MQNRIYQAPCSMQNMYAIYMDIVKRMLTQFDGCSLKKNMQKKIKSLICQHYHLAVMFFEYILKGQILSQKFRDLLWKTKLMKRVSQFTAGLNIVILVEYFSVNYSMTNSMILEAIMKKVRMKTKIKKQQLPCGIRSSFER